MDIKTTYKKETGKGARPHHGIKSEADLLASIAMTLAIENRRGRESITVEVDMVGMNPEGMMALIERFR